jgi:hypothetical protein
MTMATTRERLHEILDALPDSRLADAESALEPLLWPDAPDDDEEFTEEDFSAIAEYREERARGETIPHEVVKREMGW